MRAIWDFNTKDPFSILGLHPLNTDRGVKTVIRAYQPQASFIRGESCDGEFEFDCKVWNVPDWNTAFCHFLWRQNDCTRNSKQQAAQAYLSHKELMGKSADKQVELLKDKFGIDWNNYTDGQKYGRIIYRTQETYVDQVSGLDYVRNYWRTHEATPFGNEDSAIRTLIPLK